MNLIVLTVAATEAAKSTISNSGMSDYLKGAIITAMVTGIISIIGFIITNISMKKNFMNELTKHRDTIALEKMSTIPYEVLVLMDKMIGSIRKTDLEQKLAIKENYEHFNSLMNTIYSYGSEKAIALVSLMQRENYAANGDQNKLNKYRVMSSYVLLATQIKYDVTGISICPEFWFRMRLTDYDKNRNDFREANNKLINDLKLSSEFKI